VNSAKSVTSAPRDEVVVLSDRFWRDAFGGDPGIVGRTVKVDGRPHTVIGILTADVRVPLQYAPRQPSLYTPMSHEFMLNQRLRLIGSS
jgi:hypothetical protein